MIRFRSLFASLVLVGALAPVAHAGGFLTARFGAEEGTVTTDHVSAAYYNPAGLAIRRGWRVVAEGALGYRSVEYVRPTSAIDNIVEPTETAAGVPRAVVSANSGKASLLNAVAVPFAGVATDLGVTNLGLAFTVSVPFGGQSSWDQNKAYENDKNNPGAVDGVQRFTVIEGAQRALYLTAAGAWYVPAARLSLGVGLNFISQDIDVLRARTVNGRDDLVAADGTLLEGRTLIKASGKTLSVGLGLMYMPTESLRIGLSYQSQPGFGKTVLTGELTNKFGAGDASTSDIDFEQSLPDVVRAGLSFKPFDALELRGQFEWQHWSVFDRQCVLASSEPARNCAVNADGSAAMGSAGIVANLDRQFENSYALRAGATVGLSSRFKLMGGLTFDTSAVPDEHIDPSFVDMSKVVLVAGGRYKLNDNLALAAHWTQVFYADRSVEKQTPVKTPTRVPSSAGDYSQSVGLFQLGVEANF